MKRFKPEQQNLPYYLAFGIPFGLMLIVMLVSGSEPFLGRVSMLYSDMYHQYFPFWCAFGDALRSGESLLWDWNVGLGMDYLSLISYYLASPLNLISAITPEGWELEVFSLLMPIKLGLAGVFFTLFLEKLFGGKDMITGIFGAFYGLCAWALGYQWNIMWLDTFALLPLTVLGTVWLLRDKKVWLYTVTLFLSVFSNYYIGFFVCIFILLLFFAWELCRWQGFGRLCRDFFRIGWFTVLALGMTAILEYPALMGLQNTQSSVNAFPESFRLNIASEHTWKGLLDAMAQVAGNTLGGIEPTFKEGMPNLYCGVGSLLLAVLYLTGKETRLRDKLCSLALLIFFMVSFIIRQLDYIWHGFHFTNMIPYRFSFLFSFVVLYMAYRAWLQREQWRPWQLCLAGAAALGLMACSQDRDEPLFLVYNLCFCVLYLGTMAFGLPSKAPQAPVETEDTELYTAALAEYEAALEDRQAETLRRSGMAQRWLSWVLCIELGMSVLNFGLCFSFTYNSNYPKGTDDTAAVLEFLEKREAGNLFYRTETTHSQTLNDGAINGYNGISTFTSSANVRVTEFMQDLGFSAKNTYNRYLFEEGSPVANLFLGIKYMLERDGEVEPNRYFDEVHSSGDVYLLENNAYLPLGFLAQPELGSLYFDESLHFNQQNDLFAAATGLEGDVWTEVLPEITAENATISSVNATRVKYSCSSADGSILYTFTPDREGFLCLDFDTADRNSYKVYLNEERLYNESLSLNQMIGACDVVPGDTVLVKITCKEGEVGRMNLRAAVLDDDLFRQGHEILSASTWELTEFSGTRIAGTIDCNRDGFLYTSVPQDGNWHVYVDGAEAEAVLVNEVMVGVYLDEGIHQVEYVYRNAAFSLGWKISALCALVFALSIPVYHKRRKGHFEQ